MNDMIASEAYDSGEAYDMSEAYDSGEAYDMSEAYDSRRRPYSRGRYAGPRSSRLPRRQPLRPIRPGSFEGANKVTLDTPRGPLTADLKETVVPKEAFSQEMQKVDNAINRIADRNNALHNDLHHNVGSLENDVRRSNVQERNAFKRLREEQRALAMITTLISFVGQKAILQELDTKASDGSDKTQTAINTSALLSGAQILTLWLTSSRDIYSDSKGSNVIMKSLGGNNGPLITLLVLFALYKFDIITDVSRLFSPNTAKS
jgi:hypothetical protein